MSKSEGPPEVRAETARAVAGTRLKAVLAFFALPALFAAGLFFILYLATHWPYPPGFEWVSRWSPEDLFVAGLFVLGLFVIVCALLVWRLSARWLWEPAARVLNILEEADSTGELAQAGPPSDIAQLFYRIELAADRRRSAAEGTREIEDVQSAVGRLCQEVERMGVRRFDRDFSDARGSLEPLGRSLAECCTELSGFINGCAEVVSQITTTLRKAQERSSGLADRAESAFVGHSELSLGVKEFTRRVSEAVNIAALEARGGDYDAREALGPVARAADEYSRSLDRISEKDSGGSEAAADSKRLADEATVIALNAAIEASRSGSADLEGLAENARRLAEGAMELGEKVDVLSKGYVEAVREATAGLEDLRSKLHAWLQETRAVESGRAEAAEELREFLGSVGDMTASLAGSVEKTGHRRGVGRDGIAEEKTWRAGRLTSA
jgi:hypothetical protein